MHHTYSSMVIEEAKQDNYPLIISLGDVHSEPTELYARQMAGKDGIVAGLKLHIRLVPIKISTIKKKTVEWLQTFRFNL